MGSASAAAFGPRWAAPHHERMRCARGLANERLWRLIGSTAAAPSGVSPPWLKEVTADSDEGMVCAGYRRVGEFRSLRELRRAFDPE